MNDIIYPPGCKDIQTEIANDELIRRLKKIQKSFQDMKQEEEHDKYKQLAIYLGNDVFLEHENEDVKLLVACCLADVFRIYAPDSPYQDPNNLRKIFLFLANQLKGLKDYANTSFNRYFYLLENLASINTFLLCQELEDSQDIVADVFETVFKIINDKTPPKVKTLLFDLLNPLLNETDHINARVLDTLFARIIEPQKSNNKEAYNLAVNLIKKANEHFEFIVQNHLNNILLTSRSNLSITSHVQAMNTSLNTSISSDDSFSQVHATATTAEKSILQGTSNQFISDKLCLIIYELNTIRYSLLELVLPQLEYKLKSDDLKERREYTKLLSKMFSEKDSTLASKIPQLWEAYLERFADANEDIRKICVQHICDFLIQQSSFIKSIASSNTSTTNTQTSSAILDQIIEIIKNRSLDSEESLRYEVVQEILKAIRQDSNLITIELLNVLKDRTLDVKIKVRKLALHGLATLYKKIHSKVNNSRHTVQVINWIPSKIMRIYFQESIEDKLLVERLLNSNIVPYSLGAKEKMAQLYYAFTTFDEYSILCLIEIMKNRVFLNQIMKSMIDLIESNSKSEQSEQKLNTEMMLVSQHLLDQTKGHEFMKVFVNFLKTNHNVRNYFKNLVNVNNSCSKSLQLLNLILSNLNSLNQSQVAMAKRLIERMSSIIIDKECLEKLIELVEYKIRQRLTLKQRKLLENKRKKKSELISQKTTQKSKTRSKKVTSKTKDSDMSDYDENNEDYEDEEDEDDEDFNQDETMESLDGGEDEEQDENDDTATKTTENSKDDLLNDRLLLRHVDDDGEKGIKLLNFILLIHNNYGFNNSNCYKKLFNFVNSRKHNVSSLTLKVLSTYFNYCSRQNLSNEEQEMFNKINSDNLEKLKNLTKYGKPKQAKHAIYLIYNNFEKPKNEEILYDLYKEIIIEAELKQKSFITCLISLGHICYLIPKLVGKEIKEFISKNIVKEILMQPCSVQLNISQNETSSSLAARRKNNLKLAGKWCENEEELPVSTKARIESIKLIARWCLGLKTECTNIMFSLKILVKLLKENSSDSSLSNMKLTNTNDDSVEENGSFKIPVSEAEKSRIRSVCANQLLKLAQEPCFRQFMTPEYFHTISKLIIDPVNNVRDIMIKKLHKGLKSNKLSSFYMSIYSLCGLDNNKDRKSKVKKIYSALIKQFRQSDQIKQNQTQKTRILPEMCLSYAVSLLAHNIKIESLKNEHKVKQVKECMSLILDPLIENPDGYQIALIKKILNKVKTSDDGLATNAVQQSAQQTDNVNFKKAALQNLYIVNKSLVLICEIFLFHLHSKSTSYLTAKECQFDVKLPAGFYVARENGNNNQEEQQDYKKELEEHFKKSDKKSSENISEEKESDEIEVEGGKKEEEEENTILQESSKKGISRIEIIPINRKRKANDNQELVEEKKDDSGSRIDSDDEDIVLSDLIKSKKKNSNDSSKQEASPPPPASKRRLTVTNSNEDKKNESIEKEENEDLKPTTRSRRATRSSVSSPPKKIDKKQVAKKTNRKSKKSNDTDLEEEKENEIEQSEELEEDKEEEKADKIESKTDLTEPVPKEKEDENEEEETEEVEEEEEESEAKEDDTKSRKTRASTRNARKQTEPVKPKSKPTKKDLSKTVTESPSSYSLRQKRATNLTKK